jgi:tripartite-type tricarboxylate transporter receptor subunit TctC
MSGRKLLVLSCALLAASGAVSAWAWQPSKAVEVVIPAGEGGGADKMVRTVIRMVEKEKLCAQPFVVVNKPGGSGSEAYLYVKGKRGDDHVLLISLSSLFTLPVAMGTAFRPDEFTPLARLALDEFVLWVNAAAPYKSTGDYVTAIKANPGTFKMGGTGAGQEDQIVTVLFEQSAGVQFTYIPMGGGQSVANALADRKVDSTVNNPSEAADLWREGKVRPLGLFDEQRIALSKWKDIPTMKEQGYPASYVMMRSFFGTPGMSDQAASYFRTLLKKVYDSAEFQAYLTDNALKPAWLAGPELATWLASQNALHQDLLNKTGMR